MLQLPGDIGQLLFCKSNLADALPLFLRLVSVCVIRCSLDAFIDSLDQALLHKLVCMNILRRDDTPFHTVDSRIGLGKCFSAHKSIFGKLSASSVDCRDTPIWLQGPLSKPYFYVANPTHELLDSLLSPTTNYHMRPESDSGITEHGQSLAIARRALANHSQPDSR